MAKTREDEKTEPSAIDLLDAKTRKSPQRCLEHDAIVFYRGGVINRSCSEHAICEKLYDDGETVDLLLSSIGGQLPQPGVSHVSRLDDTENPIEPQAVQMRGLWATVEEHAELWQKAQVERSSRAKRTEKAEKDERARKEQLRKKVTAEANAPNADFEQIARKYGLHPSDVRDWVLQTA